MLAAKAPRIYIFRVFDLVVIAICALLIYFVFRDGLHVIADAVWSRPELGYAMLLPGVIAFLVWQRREEWEVVELRGSLFGFVCLAFALLLGALGKLSALYILQEYGAVLAIYGLVLVIVGWRWFRRFWAPLLLVLLIVPLPGFLYNNLSAQLQLISSAIGVWFIRLFGISVFLEGNVIDLGTLKLQVAEACDGLRYLFPLVTISFVVAYFFKGATWKRVLILVSSAPITILMNSLRIGAIGLMVDRWGIEMAEGFLHEFQGWAVFMVSIAILLLTAFVLSLLGSETRPWRETFGLEIPQSRNPLANRAVREGSAPTRLYAACLLGASLFVVGIPERQELPPSRSDFAQFPVSLGGWSGHKGRMESVYQDVLQLDDYLLADFYRQSGRPVNAYVAWYESQRAGRSAHSPRSCLPGGGWRIESLRRVSLPTVQVGGVPLSVNRAVIRLGDQRLLVYYWFLQRGRVITNEYAVKWFLLWDSLLKNRTDGALVRLTIPIASEQNEEASEAELKEFANSMTLVLPSFVPS